MNGVWSLLASVVEALANLCGLSLRNGWRRSMW